MITRMFVNDSGSNSFNKSMLSVFVLLIKSLNVNKAGFVFIDRLAKDTNEIDIEL